MALDWVRRNEQKKTETVARRMGNGYNKRKTIIIHYNFVVNICVWTEYLYSPKIHTLKP